MNNRFTKTKKEVASTIKSLRKVSGMTQARLAEKVGVTYQQIQKYENGKSVLSTDRLQQVADAFNVPVITLLGGEVAHTAQVITSYISEDEAEVLTLYRRITRKRLRDNLLHMVKDLVQLTESGQG
ncbi:helix-turn-helix domain-containing protein [Nitrospirota bacterium]